MRFFKTGFLLSLMLIIAASAYAEMKYKKFKKEEIKKMAETRAVIETKFGSMEIRFFPDVAPNHVNNFIELAKKGFYDGTTFHRVTTGFMIQGRDPNSKDPDKSKHGIGGPGYTVKAEFNEKPHKRGILSMARAAHPDSAGSQFFICHTRTTTKHLDRNHTVFGKVYEGLDVIDAVLPQDLLHAFYGVALGVEQMADAAQEFHVLGAVVAPAAAALHRADLREFRFPKAQNVLRHVEIVGHFTDGAERLGGFRHEQALASVAITRVIARSHARG